MGKCLHQFLSVADIAVVACLWRLLSYLIVLYFQPPRPPQHGGPCVLSDALCVNHNINAHPTKYGTGTRKHPVVQKTEVLTFELPAFRATYLLHYFFS